MRSRPVTSRSSRAPGRDPVKALGVILGAFFLLLVAALFLAPRRPEAPDSSFIEYAPRPETHAEYGEFPPPAGHALAGPRRAAATRSGDDEDPDDGPGVSIVLHGVVTSQDDGAPAVRAKATVGSTPQQLHALTLAAMEADADGRLKEAEALRRQANRLAQIRPAFTDSAGRYAVRLPGSGTFTLRVEAQGFVPYAVEALEIPGDQERVQHDVALSRGARIGERLHDYVSRLVRVP